MAEDQAMDIDTDTTEQEILLAATNHDIDSLRRLLRTPKGSANVVDSDTGMTPLHAAIAACEPDDETAQDKKDMDVDEAATLNDAALEEEEALKTIKFLLENGAIWNDLDDNNETPGCLALRLGLKKCYEAMVEAGVRAELLLSRLDGFELLAQYEDDSEEEEQEVEGFEILVQIDEDGQETKVDVNSEDYLASHLTFKGDRLLDADKNGVMMSWETDIMQKAVDRLCPEPGLRVLNVGHGMGIIDGIFQDKKVAVHHIIEAHPDVLARMRKDGWYEKPGVKIHEGRWQDVVPKLVEQNEVFDGIYFDTFAEEYKALKEFFTEYVIGLLDPEGRFGFFNGLGADRQVCYDVYTRVVEMDLFDAGMDTEFEDIHIPDLDEQGEWEGVRRRYWALDNYRMPTCKFVG
ncbi:arginine N-methyltransferase 2 [Aureobasidium melanogenum CBS 110374]|uniref:Arginine N-methyltransferase 2 n=1 Tax=Aureobasidium melanogenum (strain CBS 110374) TaxID=1043003 RepID=A0A074VKM1_AURM1|nr:arginine N-methyltransferase 2 [Aureobasidium melanogenum CBS 110374]KEQ61068.1 arginine N-methyltransferase 2 [Aureobasidium melanogenum CBS 110374]